MRARISTIQRFSTHDGPGIRTVVFFNGCNMNCRWCHNPESIKVGKTLGFIENKCDGCGRCISFCKEKALSLVNNKISINRLLCTDCGDCVNECYSQAFTISEKELEVCEIIEEILEDKVYFEKSGGGVTFSGGEPFLQPKALIECIKILKNENIPVIIETNFSLAVDQYFPKIINLVDYLMVDVKCFNSDLHKKWTGIGNEKILTNIKLWTELGGKIEVRTPVIEGFNDNAEEIEKIAIFCKGLKNLNAYTLIPYHPIGLIKWKQFGFEPKYKVDKFFDKERLNELQIIANKCIGGDYNNAK